MSYVTNTTAGTSRTTSDRVYPKVCGQTGAGGKQYVDVSGSAVTSWRGPIETINVGSKRRRVFRAFNIRKYNVVTPKYKWNWCPQAYSGVYSFNGTDVPLTWLRKQWERWRNDTYKIYWEGSTFPVYTDIPHKDFGEKYRTECILDLYTKLKEPRYDCAVVLAELGETVHMVRDLLIGSVRMLTKSREAWKTVKHLTLNSEELWLWYRYALIPTMLDIEDLLKAIKPEAKIDRCQTGKSKQSTNLKGTVYSHKWGPDANLSMEIPWTQELKFGYGGAIDIRKRIDPSPWGTSAIDCLRAGWEIIPFSFVFDWFVGMGDFLTTLRDVEIDYAQSYATYAVESTLRLHAGTDVTQEGTPEIRTLSIDRIIDLEPPNHPLVNTEWFNLNRSLDAIALTTGIIKSVLRGKRRRRR